MSSGRLSDEQALSCTNVTPDSQGQSMGAVGLYNMEGRDCAGPFLL
jgi:hypothetical protein